MGNSKSENNNSDNTNNQLDPSQPDFWEYLGIKPIVVDENNPNYIEKMGENVRERINQFVEELEKDN